MVGRELQDEHEPESHPADAVIFRWPRNWTAVIFFGCLGGLHLGIATTALLTFRFEAHMSLIFGTMFACVSLACLLVRREIVLEPEFRQLVIRTGLGRLACVRAISFEKVTSVRVTLLGRFHRESSVSIVCDHTDIELPPTHTPRQEALLLAMAMNVRLVKVYGDGPPPEPAQRIAKLYRNEDAI
jgi:hypothetical protein